MNTDIKFYLATPEDCNLVYCWQSNKQIRKYFINPETPNFQEHVKWYNSCLLDKNKALYLLNDNQKNTVGLLRLDQITRNEYNISIIIAPNHQGKGIAVSALQKLRQLKKNATYIARIHDENIQSQKAFVNAGFQKKSSTSYKLTVKNFKLNNMNIY